METDKEEKKIKNESKKKLKIIGIGIILIIFLMLSAMIIYNISEDKISLLQEATGKTVVDVTGLIIGEETQHEHIWKTMYDETKHWEECIICEKKQDIINHTYVDNGWTLGTSCSENNVHKYSCECGYSYTNTIGRPSHNLTTLNATANFALETRCQNSCGYGKKEHYCSKADGSKISCVNLGKCNICNYDYTISNSNHQAISRSFNWEDGEEVKCDRCNIVLGTINYVKFTKLSNNSYKFEGSVTLKAGNTYRTFGNYDNFGGKYTVSDEKNNISGSTFTFERIITFDEYREKGGSFQTNVYGILASGLNTEIVMRARINYLDSEEPVISNITIEEDSTGISEWSQTKVIKVEGTENWTKTVKVEILDEKEEKIFEGETTVNDGNYSISCIPEVEAGVDGKIFKAVVTDACNNSTEEEFTISKVDRIAPEPISGNEILGEWAKEKEYTFEATDEGIGNVLIAFNDVEDYELAKKEENTYTRKYKFIGDVYTPKEARVFYKDGLGNIKTQKITIDKIDNTKPKITEVELNKNRLSIKSNDEHETLGEGSGVEKYRIIGSKERIENLDVSEYQNIEVGVDEEVIIPNIGEMKYVYVVAEDKAGNESEVYEVKLPELELKAKVDLIGTDGKGKIDLDWSMYEEENKVFKVYRKKENQEEWEVVAEELNNETKYTDNLAKDLKGPQAPIISAEGIKEENKIKIEYESEDKGNKYTYYVESYDNDEKEILLSKSSIVEEEVKTGIKGYYYIVDTNSENIDFDIESAIYTEEKNIILDIADNRKYIHMRVVDVAENIGETSVLKIEVATKQTINLDGGVLNGKTELEIEEGIIGKTIELGIPEKEGHTFDGWEITSGKINGTEYTFGEEDGEIKAKWIKNSYKYTVEYYYDEEKDTENIETKSVEYGSIVKKYKEKQKDGYKLSEVENIPLTITANEDNNIIRVYYIKKKANVEIKYIDEVTGEEIWEKEEKEVFYGDRYETKEKEIAGYKLVEIPRNATGEVKGEEKIAVTYKYRKLSKVTAKYIDVNSNEEIERVEKEYKEGESYKTESKEIEGYRLVNSPENTNGIVKREDIEVIYEYKKLSGRVVVKHIDKDSGEVIEEEKIYGVIGEKYTTQKQELQKYNYIEVVGEVDGELVEGEIEVIYYYEKKQAIVEIIYEDENGKEVYREIMEGKVGEKYKIEIKEIENYKIKEVPENIEGIYGVEQIEVRYKVERVPIKIEINIVDEDGKVIEVIEKEGYVGEIEEIELPEIKGYYIEEKSIKIEYGKENNINITYKKEVIKLPDTGDINVFIYVIVFIVAIIGVVVGIVFTRKKSKNN